VSVPADIPVICAGSTTADAARELGIEVAAVAASPGAPDVAEAVAKVLSA
jgi:uroporphyrinogen-III synthase